MTAFYSHQSPFILMTAFYSHPCPFILIEGLPVGKITCDPGFFSATRTRTRENPYPRLRVTVPAG